MNEWFYEKNNKAYIYDEDNVKREEVLTDNIEELLIKENNIETIEKMIKGYNRSRKNCIKRLKNNLIWNTIASSVLKIVGIFGLIESFTITSSLVFYILSIMAISGLVTLDVLICLDVKKEKNFINCYDKEIKELNKTLNNEKNKLELIKSKSKEKNVKLTEPILLSKSDVIKNLSKKLDLINCYRINKKNLLWCYKNNQPLGFYNQYSKTYISEGMEEMDFIKCLIEEDLKSKDIQSKEKGIQKINSKNITK